MFTYKGDEGSTFHYNNDLSGDVRVIDTSGNEITISGNDIIDFVANCYVLPKKIEKLEQASSIELLD